MYYNNSTNNLSTLSAAPFLSSTSRALLRTYTVHSLGKKSEEDQAAGMEKPRQGPLTRCRQSRPERCVNNGTSLIFIKVGAGALVLYAKRNYFGDPERLDRRVENPKRPKNERLTGCMNNERKKK